MSTFGPSLGHASLLKRVARSVDDRQPKPHVKIRFTNQDDSSVSAGSTVLSYEAYEGSVLFDPVTPSSMADAVGSFRLIAQRRLAVNH